MITHKLIRFTVVLFIVITSLYFFQKEALLHIYKPRSLSEDKVSVMIDTLKLFRSVNIPKFGILSSGNFVLNQQTLRISADSDLKLLEQNFNLDLQSKLKESSSILDSVNISYAEKYNENYFFFIYHQPLMPTADGILYVSSDADPNKDSDEYVSKYKPYQKITDHWYHSNKLIIVRKEDDLIREDWPKALIDKSNSFSKEIIALLEEFNQ